MQSGYIIQVLESSRWPVVRSGSYRFVSGVSLLKTIVRFCFLLDVSNACNGLFLPVLTRFFANITINGEREETTHPVCWMLNFDSIIMTEGGKGRVLNRGFFFRNVKKKIPQALVDQHFIICYQWTQFNTWSRNWFQTSFSQKFHPSALKT